MKKIFCILFHLTLIGLVSKAQASSFLKAHPSTNQLLTSTSLAQGRNAISGTVFGVARHPVPDVQLELLDDVNSTISRVKTDAAGRFTFSGLVSGRYNIRVLPYGTDYLEQTQEVTLSSVSLMAGGGADRQQIDIYLKVNERVTTGPFAMAPSVVFAQDVPAAAKKLYETGLTYLREKKEKEGLESLRRAIEVFPQYYLALDRLGAEYAIRGASDRSYLEAGHVLLLKAVEVNPRSFSSAFGLGWTQYQLGLNERAVENLQKATTLYGKAADAYLWLGKALKRAKQLAQAEVALKRANELANGKSAEIHWQLAGLYNDQKQYNKAADELELFLKAQPDAADAEKIRASIRQLREKEGKAEKND